MTHGGYKYRADS